MKTLTHIPQQLDITDELIGCYVPGAESLGRYFMRYEDNYNPHEGEEDENTGWILRDQANHQRGLSGWWERKDWMVNSAIMHEFTVLSFDSQAELDAWLKEGK